MDPVRDVIWVALGTVAGDFAHRQDRRFRGLGFADSRTLQTRGYPVHEVANIGKGNQNALHGLATSEDMLSSGLMSVRRFIRATVKGREFLKRIKLSRSRSGKNTIVRPTTCALPTTTRRWK
jgi:hypothetical protein